MQTATRIKRRETEACMEKKSVGFAAGDVNKHIG